MSEGREARLKRMAKMYEDDFIGNWQRIYGPQTLGKGMFPSTTNPNSGVSPLGGQAVDKEGK